MRPKKIFLVKLSWSKFLHFTYCDALMSYFDVACISLKSNFTPFGNLLGYCSYLNGFQAQERKPVLRIILKILLYVCGQSLSSSFPLISPSFFEVVEGERHYFMYASICYFCKNENRKKTFTSNTSEKPTWSRMIITGAKFKQGNFRTFSTLH